MREMTDEDQNFLRESVKKTKFFPCFWGGGIFIGYFLEGLYE